MGDERERAGGGGSPPETAAEVVDLTLIDEMLRLTPARSAAATRQNDRMATIAMKLRAGFDARTARWPSRET